MPYAQPVGKLDITRWRVACSDLWRSAGAEYAGQEEERKMLHYALIFFLIAIVAAVFGFGSIAGASAGIAQILFFLFLVVFLVTLVMGVARRA
jgi:uncharacterized membrane protein YtjA (UPF0391 family)